MLSRGCVYIIVKRCSNVIKRLRIYNCEKVFQCYQEDCVYIIVKRCSNVIKRLRIYNCAKVFQCYQEAAYI